MKLACITGASSGIGKEFAYLLAELEYDLILVGRNTDALHEIADNVAVRCKCIAWLDDTLFFALSFNYNLKATNNHEISLFETK